MELKTTTVIPTTKAKWEKISFWKKNYKRTGRQEEQEKKKAVKQVESIIKMNITHTQCRGYFMTLLVNWSFSFYILLLLCSAFICSVGFFFWMCMRTFLIRIFLLSFLFCYLWSLEWLWHIVAEQILNIYVTGSIVLGTDVLCTLTPLNWWIHHYYST